VAEIEVDGVRVSYRARPGGAVPLVFLHGGFGSSSALWARAMDALPPYCSAYAIDNFLASDPPPGGYNVGAFARRTAGFARALGLERPILVGHSMGGVVCQLAGIEHPAAVGGLVLVCTGPSMTDHRLGRELLDRLRREGGDERNMRAISANWFYRVPEDGFFDRYVADAARAPLEAMIEVQESLIATDLRPLLGRIAVPTLVVHGGYDTGRTIEHARALLDGIRGSELAVMRHSGHSPMVETPQEFDAALHDFLARRAAAQPAAM